MEQYTVNSATGLLNRQLAEGNKIQWRISGVAGDKGDAIHLVWSRNSGHAIFT